MRKGTKDDYKKGSSYNKKKNDDGCLNVARLAIMPKIVEFPPLSHIMRGARRKRSLLLLGVMKKRMIRPRKKSTSLLWLKAPTQVTRKIIR